MNSAIRNSQFNSHSAQTEGIPPVTWERGPLSRAPLFSPFKVQPATGLKNELVSYMPAHGILACPICGSISTAAVPDFLGRERKGWIWNFCLALARKRYHKRHGGTCVKKVEQQAVKLAKGYDRIAAVVAKTYAVQGDAALSGGLTDDEALILIMDVLNDIDPTLIERNAKKKLSRSKSG